MRATICGLGDQDAEERLNAVLLALGADWHDAADAAAPGGREIRIAGHAARVFTEGDALALEGPWEAVHPVVAAYNRSAQAKMRSFHVYSTPPKPGYALCVENYSKEECARLRSEFKSCARWHRIFRWIFRTTLLILFAAVFVRSYFAPSTGSPSTLEWILILLPIFVVVILGCQFIFLKTSCPGCARALVDIPERYCPECGNYGIARSLGSSLPHCSACSTKFRMSKGRNYSIRHCTHCGLKVDEKGL